MQGWHWQPSCSGLTEHLINQWLLVLRFSGLRFAPPENDDCYAPSFRSIHLISGSSGSTQASPSVT